METIKTTTETYIVNGNDTWENLGDISIYDYNGRSKGSGTLLFKIVPGLGRRFKVIYNNKTYTLEKTGGVYNAKIGAIGGYLNVEGFE